MTVQNDERGTTFCFMEDVQRLLDAHTIVRVTYPQNVPTIREESSRDILGERQTRVPLDRDVIVIVDPAEIVEAEMTGERCRFRRYALHQTTVSTNGVDVVVENLEARFIEAAGEPLLADCHADARGNPLAQRASRGLDTRYPVVLGVSRRLAVELAETPDVVERYGRVTQSFIFGIHSAGASEMQCRP